tara:strand:+ start:20593 stop:21798 length:1206 start_codon:yes stop_codon:yes gene_type:complete
MNFLVNIVFAFALTMVSLSLLSVIFPGLILSHFGDIVSDKYDAFELGNNATLLIISNLILIPVGFLYKKNIVAVFSLYINKVRTFEITKKQSLIVGILILTIYIVIVSPELTINEITQWADYNILIAGLESFPETNSGDFTIDEQNGRFVRMILLGFSQDYFGNIKIIPFIASISVVALVGLITTEIAQRRIAGIIAMIIFLQSYTFLEYDTIAVYENLWVMFFLLSIYTIQKQWYLSGITYLLSVFTKAFVTPFLVLNIYYVLRSENSRATKIRLLISYGIMILIMVGLLYGINAVYGNVILVDFDRFANSLSDFSSQLRYDSFLLVMILPVTIGLFFTARKGLKHADSMLFFIPSLILFGPLLTLITDAYVILPYRFLPLVAFFAISTSLIIFNNVKSK